RLSTFLDVLPTKHEAVPPGVSSSVNAQASSFSSLGFVVSFFGRPPSLPHSFMRFLNSRLPQAFCRASTLRLPRALAASLTSGLDCLFMTWNYKPNVRIVKYQFNENLNHRIPGDLQSR